jgi:voltage-gated potassium channel
MTNVNHSTHTDERESLLVKTAINREIGYHFSLEQEEYIKINDPWSKYQKVQCFIWNMFEQIEPTRLGRVVNMVIVVLIFVTLFTFVMSTESDLMQHQWLVWTLFIVEHICLAIFCIEYLLRLFACTAPNSKYSMLGALLGRLRYLFSIWAMVDLIAILPSVVTLVISIVLAKQRGANGSIIQQDVFLVRELFVLRVLRILRLLKAEKYFNGWSFITTVLKKKRMDLLTAFFINFVIIMLASTTLYFAENAVYVDPKTGKRGNPDFSSIPRCIYWSIIVLSTVGQGDIYPRTGIGRAIACFCAISAISAFAIPSSILSSGFIEEISLRKQQLQKKEDTQNAHPQSISINGTEKDQVADNKFSNSSEGRNDNVDGSSSIARKGQVTFAGGGSCIYCCPHCSTYSSFSLKFS